MRSGEEIPVEELAHERQRAAVRSMKWFWIGAAGAVGLWVAMVSPNTLFKSDAWLVQKAGASGAFGIGVSIMALFAIGGFGRFVMFIRRALALKRRMAEQTPRTF